MRVGKKTFDGNLIKQEYRSPVGRLCILASEVGVRAVFFENFLNDVSCQKNLLLIPTGENQHIKNAIAQLDQYFRGGLKDFTLEIDPVGTDFQKSAWIALSKIPYGRTYSYSQQAELLGSKKLARAVGGANRLNPLSIVVPCHRVIGKSGDLTGFGGGLDTKKYLLDFESKHLSL